jgi:hypothetical protein
MENVRQVTEARKEQMKIYNGKVTAEKKTEYRKAKILAEVANGNRKNIRASTLANYEWTPLQFAILRPMAPKYLSFEPCMSACFSNSAEHLGSNSAENLRLIQNN